MGIFSASGLPYISLVEKNNIPTGSNSSEKSKSFLKPTTLESMVQAALLKQQDDIAALVIEVNALKGKAANEKPSSKFDMDDKPADPTGAPPVG